MSEPPQDREDSEDSGEVPTAGHASDAPGEAEASARASDENASDAAPSAPQRGLLDEPEFHRFTKVVKIFLWPFLFSWGVAFVGGARNIDWLHFTGLGGVLLCMIALLVWLIS